MVLGGLVNKAIVSHINRAGGRAVGLTGKDGNLLTARKLLMPRCLGVAGGEGERPRRRRRKRPRRCRRRCRGRRQRQRRPETARCSISASWERSPRSTPLSWITWWRETASPSSPPSDFLPTGRGYNINSDLVAGKVAEAMRAAKLILLTNTPGLLDENGATVSEMNLAQAPRCGRRGSSRGAMLPKVQCALDAVRGGVAAATIADGRVEHATLLEVFHRSRLRHHDPPRMTSADSADSTDSGQLRPTKAAPGAPVSRRGALLRRPFPRPPRPGRLGTPGSDRPPGPAGVPGCSGGAG